MIYSVLGVLFLVFYFVVVAIEKTHAAIDINVLIFASLLILYGELVKKKLPFKTNFLTWGAWILAVASVILIIYDFIKWHAFGPASFDLPIFSLLMFMAARLLPLLDDAKENEEEKPTLK